jgi:hypothetical protein
MADPIVVCPKCGHRFAVTKALTDQIEVSLRHQFEARAEEQEKAAQVAYEKRLAAEREKLEKQVTARAAKASAAQVAKLRGLLADAKKREKTAQASFVRQLAAEKSRLQREAVNEAKASVSSQLVDLRKQIRESEAAVQEMQKREAAVQEREKLLKAKEQDIQKAIAREREVTRKKTLQETSERIEKEYHTRELQHQKVVSDLKKQLTDARRKLEQSSQQSQGEVIELELERTLAGAFPDDKIRPIAKGKLGADIIHKIISPSGQHCGTIVWESKNTKNWNKSWLAKLRSDQRREKAEIAVLVSSALPKDMRSHLCQMSGVWLTDFSVATGLATVLRANLIELSRIRMTSQGKTEKMEVLYQYLMSTEFRQRVEAIVEGFTTMRDDLNKEKQATERNWAKREKHLHLVLQNVSGMVGDIQAISPAFPKIKRLELPAPR